MGRLVDILERACLRPPGDAPRLADLVSVKESKLPAWMRPVPQGGLAVTTRTREVASDAQVRQAVNGAGAPARPAVSPTSTTIHPSGPTPTPSSRHVGPSWSERFGRGFGETIKGLVWLWVLSLFFRSPALIIGGGLLLLFLAIIAGFGAAVTRTATVSTATPLPPARPSSSRPASPSRRAASGGASGLVVASSIRTIYHRPGCEWALKMSRRNRLAFASAAEARNRGFRPCRVCRP